MPLRWRRERDAVRRPRLGKFRTACRIDAKRNQRCAHETPRRAPRASTGELQGEPPNRRRQQDEQRGKRRKQESQIEPVIERGIEHDKKATSEPTSAPRHARRRQRGPRRASARRTNSGTSASRMSGDCVCTSQTGVIPQVLGHRAQPHTARRAIHTRSTAALRREAC